MKIISLLLLSQLVLAVEVSTPTFGTATLLSGSTTVKTKALNNDSFIAVVPIDGKSSGSLYVSDKSSDGFSIRSSNINDSRSVQWIILQPKEFRK